MLEDGVCEEDSEPSDEEGCSSLLELDSSELFELLCSEELELEDELLSSEEVDLLELLLSSLSSLTMSLSGEPAR